jgi:hypothetical protein
VSHLRLVGGHEHAYKRYVLRSEGDETVKEYTEADVEMIPGFFFIGYDCECGGEGYGV